MLTPPKPHSATVSASSTTRTNPVFSHNQVSFAVNIGRFWMRFRTQKQTDTHGPSQEILTTQTQTGTFPQIHTDLCDIQRLNPHPRPRYTITYPQVHISLNSGSSLPFQKSYKTSLFHMYLLTYPKKSLVQLSMELQNRQLNIKVHLPSARRPSRINEQSSNL